MKIWDAYRCTSSANGCRLWNGALSSDGRPVIHVEGVGMRQLNRILWSQKHGEIASGMRVVMTCRNRTCIERDHMALMNHAEASAFAAEGGAWKTLRKRMANITGRRKWAKLKPEDVQQIRVRLAAGEKQSAIAADYPVSREAIKKIKDGRLWSDRIAPNASVFHQAA